MSLVETDWLEKNQDNVKIIDCSWHMPQTKRNGWDEYKNQHIPNALFFDLDKNSKKDSDLPHMLVDKNEWEKIVSEMGIDKEDRIVQALHNTDWQFQLDNEFPQRLSENKLFIPKETYHRLIKGTGDLKVKIFKL